jgi:hypothetical protein
VIDPAVDAALGRIAARERDLRHTFQAGFSPEANDAADSVAPAPSSDPLSVVAPDGTYFAAESADGSVAYTRDGAFRLVDGALVDGSGRVALGFAPGERATPAPLRLDPYDVALGRAADARLAADGTLSYARAAIDPRSGERRVERVVAGRLVLARFPAGTQPERLDPTHVRAPRDVAVHVAAPGERGFAQLVTHARDRGRIDLLVGLERMRDAYDAFEALRSANHARGGVEKTAMDLLK